MLLLSGNNILVHELDIQAVKHILQTGSAVGQAPVKGDCYLIHFRSRGGNCGLNTGNGNRLSVHYFSIQVEICGDFQRPFLLSGVKGQG